MNTIQLMYNYHRTSPAYQHSYTKAKVAVVLLHDRNLNKEGLSLAIDWYIRMTPETLIVYDVHGTPFDSDLIKRYQQEKTQILFKTSEQFSSVGALINNCMETVKCDALLVSWSHLNPFGLSLMQLTSNLMLYPLCTVPLIENDEGKILPSVYKARKSMFGYKAELNKENPMMPFTFLIHNYVGIYRKDLFKLVGGFDEDLQSAYWQLYEFGMRVYARSEHIRMSPYFRTRTTERASFATFSKAPNLAEKLLARLKTMGGIVVLESLLYLFLQIRRAHLYEIMKTLRNKKIPKSVFKHSFAKHIQEYWV